MFRHSLDKRGRSLLCVLLVHTIPLDYGGASLSVWCWRFTKELQHKYISLPAWWFTRRHLLPVLCSSRIFRHRKVCVTVKSFPSLIWTCCFQCGIDIVRMSRNICRQSFMPLSDRSTCRQCIDWYRCLTLLRWQPSWYVPSQSCTSWGIQLRLQIFKIIAPYVILSVAFAAVNYSMVLPPFSLFLVAVMLTDGKCMRHGARSG